MLSPQDLHGVDLFAGLNPAELTEVARICNRSRFAKNTDISQYISSSNDILILERENDSIQIELPIDDNPARLVTHILKKGETFAWSAFFAPQLKTISAHCLEDAIVININVTDLMKILTKDNHIGFVIMQNLSSLINRWLICTTIALRHEIKKHVKGKNINIYELICT